MKKLIYITSIFFLLFSCDKVDDLYYSYDTVKGYEIKDKTGKDLLDSDLVVEKITLTGNNNGGVSPTEGKHTPDGPPFESFSVEKKGAVNVLYLSFDPIYKESNIIINWKNIAKGDTLSAELYKKKNTVYPSKIFWNGMPVWTEGQHGNKGSIKVEKDI